MVGPTPLIFGFRVRAIGTRVSVVPPIGAGSLGVRSIVSPRCCIGLTTETNEPHRNSEGQSEVVVHSGLLS